MALTTRAAHVLQAQERRGQSDGQQIEQRESEVALSPKRPSRRRARPRTPRLCTRLPKSRRRGQGEHVGQDKFQASDGPSSLQIKSDDSDAGTTASKPVEKTDAIAEPAELVEKPVAKPLKVAKSPRGDGQTFGRRRTIAAFS